MSNCFLLKPEVFTNATGVNSKDVTETAIGEGAYGKVYLLLDQATGKSVVRKDYDLDSSSYFSLDFLTELNTYQLLRGVKNITSFYGACYDKNKATSSIFLEAMYGNLSKLPLLTNLDYQQRLQLLPDFIRQLASGLCALHSLGILHNDLTPNNILFRKAANGDLIFKIADLGMSGPKERIIQQGHLGGTLWLRPPEVLSSRDINSYDYFKIDTWALGICCLYVILKSYTLTGETPYELLKEIWLHSSNEDNFAIVEEFSLANRSGLITGTLDVKAILQSGYQQSDVGIINTVTSLVTLNPDQRPLASQLTNCQQLETVIDYNLAEVVPDSYDHNLELWYVLRRCSNDVAVVTVSYELCLRVLQKATLTNSWLSTPGAGLRPALGSGLGPKPYQRLAAVVVFLAKSYLYDRYRNLPFFKALTEDNGNKTSDNRTSNDTDEFIVSTIAVMIACQGCLYNYHCTRAIDSISDDLFFSTTYYQPNNRRIEVWYSTANDDEIRQRQRQYLDNYQVAYQFTDQSVYQQAEMEVAAYLPIINVMISFSNSVYDTFIRSLLLAVDYFYQVVQAKSIDANNHTKLLLIAISCLEVAENFDQAGISGYLSIFNKKYAEPKGVPSFSLEDFNNCLTTDVLPNLDLSIITASDYLWLSQWQTSDEHSNLVLYMLIATITSGQAYLTGDLLPSALWLACFTLANEVLGTDYSVSSHESVQIITPIIITGLKSHRDLNSSIYRIYIAKKQIIQQLYLYVDQEE